MAEVPDKVIEQATDPGAWMVAADFACHNHHDGPTPCYECREDAAKVVRAAAPVIAAWARRQERERLGKEFGPTLVRAEEMIRGEYYHRGWEGSHGHRTCVSLLEFANALDREESA